MWTHFLHLVLNNGMLLTVYTLDMIPTSKGQSIPLGFGSRTESVHNPDNMLPFFNIRSKVYSRKMSQDEINFYFV